jgi:hypothetical protein
MCGANAERRKPRITATFALASGDVWFGARLSFNPALPTAITQVICPQASSNRSHSNQRKETPKIEEQVQFCAWWLTVAKYVDCQQFDQADSSSKLNGNMATLRDPPPAYAILLKTIRTRPTEAQRQRR